MGRRSWQLARPVARHPRLPHLPRQAHWPAAAARAASSAAAQHDCAPLHLQPGAGHARARFGHALHGPVRGPAARLARCRQRRVLRSAPHRHRAHGLLLSGSRCGRRRSAAAPECAPAWQARLFAVMPQLELILLVGSYAQRWHLGDARQRQHDRRRQTLAIDCSTRRAGPAMCRCRIRPGATMGG